MRIESEQFRARCADLIDHVVRRLDALDIAGTHLQEEWSAIQSADSEEFAFCSAAARLGWNPYAVEESKQAVVLKLADQVQRSVFDEALSALDPKFLQEGCTAITDAIVDSKTRGLLLERFHVEHEDVLTEATDGFPWEVGYQWARTLRRDLDLDGLPIATIGALAECIGEGPDLFESRTPIPRLQRDVLIERLNGRRAVDADDVDELAVVFGVSSLVVEHQIRNHQLAKIII